LWLANLLVELPTNVLRSIVQHSFPAAILYLGVVGMVGLMGLGLWSVRRQCGRVLSLYLLFYLVLIWIWPFDPYRFLIPLLPLLFGAWFVGLGRLAVQFGVGLDDARARRPVGGQDRLGLVLASPGSRRVMLVLAGVIGLLYLNAQSGVAASRSQALIVRQIEGAASLLKRLTPPDAVVIAPNSAFYLLSGRHVIPFVPSEDPVAFYYPPDRLIRHLGLASSSPAMVETYRRVLEEKYLSYSRVAGATHILVPSGDRDSPLERTINAWLESHRDQFRQIDQSEKFRLYAIRP
jgi:hypothetical protein